MKTIPLLALFALLFCQKAGAQVAQLDTLQARRLAGMCQLWGHVHFFHPFLAYRDLPWDSAFAAAVPKAIAAPDSAAYVRVLEEWLAALDDPATRVKTGGKLQGAFSTGEKHPLAHFDADSVLIITVNNYHDLSDWNAAIEKFAQITALVPLAKGVLFDLRSDQPVGDNTWVFDYAASESGLNASLSGRPLTTPGARARMYDGFPPENGSTSGGYYAAFYVTDGQQINPAPGTKSVPTVFLLNKNSFLPPVAVALQAAGQGAIIAQGEVSDALLASVVPLDMGEGIIVQFRTSEIITSNGVTGLAFNRMLPEALPHETARQAALDFLKKGDFSQPPGLGPPPMVATLRPAQYPGGVYPSLGYRVLAAAKVWSVIANFFAYRDLMESDWDEVLRKSLPAIAAAQDSVQYVMAIAEMYAHLQDGHGFVRSLVLRDHLGTAYPPFVLRMIEDQPVITAIAVDSVCRSLGLEVGDILTHVGGIAVQDELERQGRFVSASNLNWRNNRVLWRMLRGPEGSTVQTRWQGKDQRVKTVAVPRQKAWQSLAQNQESGRSGTPVLRLLDGNIGYADLERLTVEQVDTMFEQFKNTRAIIFDMRGYPKGTAWTIAPRLTERRDVAGALFQRYVALSPPVSNGEALTAFTKNYFYQRLPYSSQWKYKGRTVMLIDDRTMSQAEHTGLFFEAANGTKFIGSQTAGANGDVTGFSIPGNIGLNFSGHDVRHADGRQLQKTGLVPDVPIRPTIAGIRAGKDEVLEGAIRWLQAGQ